MVDERTCDFTGESIEPGTGIMYVRTDGTILHFANSKAEKNYLKGREPRDLEWTDTGPGSVDSSAPAEPEETQSAEHSETSEQAAADEDEAEVPE